MSMRERLDETIKAGLAEGLHAIVVIHNGQTVLEHYGSGDYDDPEQWRTPTVVLERAEVA